ncbi:MAG: MBL fold metallo-hydrolase [Blautia sp.]
MSKPRITTLMEDTLCGSGLEAEHGLSLYIETKNTKFWLILVRAQKHGQMPAQKIDITKVDTVFLSHGHYDHSGGLMTFASANPSADIYIHENAGGEYYSFKEGGERYIGIDKSILTLSNLHQIKNNTIIDEELSIFTNVSQSDTGLKETNDYTS